MTTRQFIFTICFLLLICIHNKKLYAQAQGTSTSFEMAEEIGTFSEPFRVGPLTRNTEPEYHYPIFIHDELNYVLDGEETGDPIRDFWGSGPAMYFKFKFDSPFRMHLRTENMPELMNGIYMHIAVKRKKKFYVIYTCLGKGEYSMEEVREFYPDLLYDGNLNLNVNIDVHPDEYYVIIAGVGIRPRSVNYGYMHVYFEGSPIPESEQDSANYLPSLDPNVLPVFPEVFENISAVDDMEIEKQANLNLSANRVYIYNRIYTNADASNYKEDIQYYDGLGRLKQVVQRDAAPTFRDIVNTYDYDSKDRILRKWLPVKVGGNNEGRYVYNYKDQASTYYRDSAYINNEYESPYMDRNIITYAPGSTYKDWEVSFEQKYLFNKGNTGPLACLNLKAANQREISIQRNGYYPTGELYVTKTINEDGHIQYSFTDKTGKLLLTRQMNGEKEHDTYYVYDGVDNLRAVLPPIAIDKYPSGIRPIEDINSLLKKYAYLYIYDDYNRCIAKKLPGCDWNYYIYDKADQLIFAQDGEQRERDEWTYSIPDLLGRTVITGVCNHTLNYMGDPLSTVIVRAEQASSGNSTHLGYNITGIALESKDIYTVNYYDDYDFLLNLSDNFRNRLGYIEKTGYDSRYIDPVMQMKTPAGLLVGTRVKSLGETKNLPVETITTFWYDDRARLIQSHSTNHLGGIDSEYIEYNYIGQPLKTMYVHTATNKVDQTGEYSYTYDHAGRLLTTTYQHNQGETILLTENTYDEVGRLKSNKKGNTEIFTSVFDYNVRSWLTSIDNKLFTEALQYTFTGNILYKDWQQSQQKHQYKFKYDGLSRLLSADYSIPIPEQRAYSSAYSSAYGVAGPGREEIQRNYSTRYTYDKHGNISSLKRYGKQTDPAASYGVIEDIAMSYTGNQLTSIAEVLPLVPAAGLNNANDLNNLLTQYTYNKNGALIKDSRKGILEIQYNSLNLPQQMDIKNSVAEARSKYLYSAIGTKLRVTQHWNPDFETTAETAGQVNENLLSKEQVTDYIGNHVYENGNLKRILLPGGYYEPEAEQYYFYITDHLGNNRIVANRNGEVIQETNYYPFGSSFAEGTGEEVQPYKYNGKELDSRHGLNLYDYSARYYDPAFGRFTTMDPLAEKYYSVSPYAYVLNNPLRFIDPDGMDHWEVGKDGSIKLKEENPEEFRLYNYKGEYMEINDESILKELSIQKENKTQKWRYKGHYATSQSSEMGDIFLFVAENSGVEWGLQAVDTPEGKVYILSTNGEPGIVHSDRARNDAGHRKSQLVLDMHSHPAHDGTRGASNVSGAADDMWGIKLRHELMGDKLPPHYVYHRASQTLYRYTLNNPSIFDRKINFQNQGNKITIKKNGFNF